MRHQKQTIKPTPSADVERFALMLKMRLAAFSLSQSAMQAREQNLTLRAN